MRYKQASVDLMENYVKYRGLRALREGRRLPPDEWLEHLLYEMKWKGVQVFVTIEPPARRREGETEEDQLRRSFRRQPWIGDADNYQSERIKRARERGR